MGFAEPNCGFVVYCKGLGAEYIDESRVLRQAEYAVIGGCYTNFIGYGSLNCPYLKKPNRPALLMGQVSAPIVNRGIINAVNKE